MKKKLVSILTAAVILTIQSFQILRIRNITRNPIVAVTGTVTGILTAIGTPAAIGIPAVIGIPDMMIGEVTGNNRY